jgi:hypothetical protein
MIDIGDLANELQARGPMELTLRPQTVLQLVGMLQLAMRHPQLGTINRSTAVTFIAGARAYFADAPTVLAVLDAGDDPSQDR